MYYRWAAVVVRPSVCNTSFSLASFFSLTTTFYSASFVAVLMVVDFDGIHCLVVARKSHEYRCHAVMQYVVLFVAHTPLFYHTVRANFHFNIFNRASSLSLSRLQYSAFADISSHYFIISYSLRS